MSDRAIARILRVSDKTVAKSAHVLAAASPVVLVRCLDGSTAVTPV